MKNILVTNSQCVKYADEPCSERIKPNVKDDSNCQICVCLFCLFYVILQGVCDELCEACERLGWTYATEIQKKVIPLALNGHDIVGIAETGSGKTAAFALPIIQDLLKGGKYDRRIFALVMVPTHELAEQVANQFRALGSSIGLKCG